MRQILKKFTWPGLFIRARGSHPSKHDLSFFFFNFFSLIVYFELALFLIYTYIYQLHDISNNQFDLFYKRMKTRKKIGVKYAV